MRRLASLATCVAGLALVVALTPVAVGASPSTAWVDQSVTFTSGGLTIHATYRHPVHATKPLPAVLLIAGSGPTDRNGNSIYYNSPIDNIRQLADWLSSDGVASLRYDKLGSGETGLGPYATKTSSIGISVFEQEARSALVFLAHRRGVDPKLLGVFGHSEGAFYALLLAAGHAGVTPPIHALGLFEPLSTRYLNLVHDQVTASLDAQVATGTITPDLKTTVEGLLANAIAQIRTKGTVAANLPYGLANILSPSTAHYFFEADRLDPAALATRLPPHTPVLLTCSDADVQITCGEVNHLVRGLVRATSRVDWVHLQGIDHELKVDASRTEANYAKPLPFSPTVRDAIANFVRHYL